MCDLTLINIIIIFNLTMNNQPKSKMFNFAGPSDFDR